MSDVRPVYQLFNIDLSQVGENSPGMGTGRMTLRGEFDYLRLIDATDAGGNFNPLVKVNVTVGRSSEDGIPLRINGLIEGRTEVYTVTWALQAAGFTAVLLATLQGGDAPGLSVEAPPSFQLISTASGTQFATSQVNVGVVATLLLPGVSTRQAGSVRNLDATKTLYIGPAGVTVATGYPLYPGESFDVRGTTAAVYGITTAGTVAAATESEF